MDSSPQDERQSFVRGLPSIPEKDVTQDETCAICQETFLAIIAAQEMASVMETPGHAEEDMGVVQLPGCGHRFCRKDIATWVYSSRSTCPACRNEFLPASMRSEPQGVPVMNEAIEAARIGELMRALQQSHASDMYLDADATQNNPFNEGGLGVNAPSEPVDHEGEEEELDEETFRSILAAARTEGRETPRESFGMYS